MTCDEPNPDVKAYILKDDLHGHKNLTVHWCDECKAWHTTTEPELDVTLLN